MNVRLENSASITVQAIKDDLDVHANQLSILAESLVLARMQEQTGFVKHILGSAAEDVWNNL